MWRKGGQNREDEELLKSSKGENVIRLMIGNYD